MIASVAFRNFKALRNTTLDLAPFNLVIGPNGSGKTSLIQALVRLRDLALSPSATVSPFSPRAEALELSFRFAPPHADVEARISCSAELVWDLLQVKSPSPERWAAVRDDLARLRSYVFDHTAMAEGSPLSEGGQLAPDGANLAAVLGQWQRSQPAVFGQAETEFCRLLPEFIRLEIRQKRDGRQSITAVLGDGSVVPAENLSQGTFYSLAMVALACDPQPPPVLCIEEMDRGIHPRMLREVRDLLYRLSYPASVGASAEEAGGSADRTPVQIIATTHSPYLLDLFREHPEEVVIAQKQGQEARFERLADRPDLPELLQEGTLGDMWFAGILGGVPDEDNEARSDGKPQSGR